MASPYALKDLVRPPFANYDVVVYFGCGLFVVPFVNRYLVVPLGLHWPTFRILGADVVTGEIISGLSLLVFVYVIGHVIAYLASQIIEKTIDRFLGKVSTAVTFLTVGRPGIRNSKIRSHIWHRIQTIRNDRAIVASFSRAIFHIPAIFAYILIGAFGIFGYFNSRMSLHTVAALKDRIRELGIPQLTLSPNKPWFKPVEYFVINRVPSAIPRMYNYLVIGGLFRSLSFIFLMSMWAVAIHAIFAHFKGQWRIPPLSGMAGGSAYFWEFFSLQALYVFSLFSYIKFQRRYAEEALFAFLFSPQEGQPAEIGLTLHLESAAR